MPWLKATDRIGVWWIRNLEALLLLHAALSNGELARSCVDHTKKQSAGLMTNSGRVSLNENSDEPNRNYYRIENDPDD